MHEDRNESDTNKYFNWKIKYLIENLDMLVYGLVRPKVIKPF